METPGPNPKAMQTVTFEPGKEADPELSLKASKSTLRVGETVQLAAQERQANGTWVDVTKDSGTVYYTTSESKLVPEPDGRVDVHRHGRESQRERYYWREKRRQGGQRSVHFTCGRPRPYSPSNCRQSPTARRRVCPATRVTPLSRRRGRRHTRSFNGHSLLSLPRLRLSRFERYLDLGFWGWRELLTR